MVAKVLSLVTRDFIDYPSDGYTIPGINKVMQDAEDGINTIIEKIRSRGYFMENIQLEEIGNITQVEQVLNRNIDKINLYFSSLNTAFKESYMLEKEILEVMKIDVVNTDSMSSIVVFSDRIDIEINNGQIVSVKSDEVTSVKGTDTKTITHA